MDDVKAGGRTLDRALRAVAAEDEPLGASAAVAARLFVEVHAIARARQRRANLIGLAAAAALFIGIVADWYSSPAPAGEREAPPVIVSPVREVTTAFFPLTYSTVPASEPHLIRMQVPRSALASFGVTSFGAGGDQAPTVLADVVVGEDGLARAVRFVRVLDGSLR